MNSEKSALTEFPPRRIGPSDFVTLLVRNDRHVRSFLATLLGRIDDVEEAMQRTCLVAWKKISTFSYSKEAPDDEFQRWICTIGRFEVLAMHRSSQDSRLIFSSELVDQLAALQIEEASSLE